MADTYNSTGVVNQSDPVIGAVVIDYSGGNQPVANRANARARGIYVATTGTLKADMADGSTVTFVGLAAGVVYPFCVTLIYQTGSSISGHILY